LQLLKQFLKKTSFWIVKTGQRPSGDPTASPAIAGVYHGIRAVITYLQCSLAGMHLLEILVSILQIIVSTVPD